MRFALGDVVEAVFAQILDDLGVGELRDGAEPWFQDLHRAGVGVLEVDRVPVERFRLDEFPIFRIAVDGETEVVFCQIIPLFRRYRIAVVIIGHVGGGFDLLRIKGDVFL
ncbi:MAG: hypothetical protein IJJ28_04245, partial [Lentisphaeria bacterium]|nr:hypothetical protein [Lentisphaeria bacterium]